MTLLTLLAPFAGVLGLPAIGTAIVGGALVAGSDPSKGITHGGRPDGALNPGDELPGVGGGSAGGGEGAWARAKRLGRAALNAVGLGGGGGKKGAAMPGIPDSVPMTADERNTLGLIMKYESHGQNTMNYEGKRQGLDPQTAKGYTAQGYYQMLNSNWRRIAPGLGIQAPNAMSGSLEDQTRVALHLLRNGGVSNWSNYNPALRAALARGEQAPVPVSPSVALPSAAKKPGWIDADTYTDGLNTFKKGADGNLKRATNLPGQPETALPKLSDAARAFSDKATEGANRLDPSKLKAIGAATEGFRPEEYFKTAPPVGTSTNNDNSVRHQSYNRGDSTVNIYTQADARETHDLWRRHEDRQKADDLRHASNVFAA